MPTRLDLPSLGDHAYAELLAELTAAIPRYSDTWTDFNASDPGITLLQLIAWLGDVTFYRIDALPVELYLNFARLLVGADADELDTLIATLEADVLTGEGGSVLYIGSGEVVKDPARLALARYLRDVNDGAVTDLATLRRHALDYWTGPYRAVTARDLEQLAMQVTADVPADEPLWKLRRVIVRTIAPFLEVVIVTDYPVGFEITPTPPPSPGPLLLTLTAQIQYSTVPTVEGAYSVLVPAVVQYLEPRRLLGTPLRVRAPVYNPVEFQISLALAPRADAATVLQAVFDAVAAFLSPLTGGLAGTGWPYGRAVARDEVIQVIARVPGIDGAQPLRVAVQTVFGFVVGTSRLTLDALIGSGDEIGLPRLWSATIEARTSTWTFTLDRHARVGIDTVLEDARG